jgi:methionyl-tRNA synthetase
MNRTIKKVYLTTPIFYPNNQLHLGHAYTLTITDIIARYKGTLGCQVYFQTGSDEHGEKIVKTAINQNITPQQLVDKNILLFKKLWKKLNISENYFFMRTTFSSHITKVQEVFTKLLSNNDIYLGLYKGNYCIVCEEYILKSETCNSCGSELKWIEEEAYFFKIEKYRERLIKHYKNNPNFLSPNSSVNELFQSFLNQKIPDLCITRNNLDWGVPVPQKNGMTIYVWFDALCNYLTSEEGEKFFSFENSELDDSEIIQVIGKDILRFHAIYWISLLFSLQKKIPSKIISHGWILNSGSKMSKSKGNVINPFKLLENHKSDTLRAYFSGKVTIYNDGIIDEKVLQLFYENFFLNSLGNLLSRVFKMLEIYNNNEIPIITKIENSFLVSHQEENKKNVQKYKNSMDDYQITSAFNEIQNMITNSNKLISNIKPWKLFSERKIDLLNETLMEVIHSIEIIGFLLYPITPETSSKIFSHLKINIKEVNFDNLLFLNRISGKKLEKNFIHLFK